MIAGTGVDIIEVERIDQALRRHGDRFLRRVFTPGEIAYCEASDSHRCRRLAARYAAKEAALKAFGLGLREVKWTDIEVIRDDLGRPALRLAGRLAEIAAQQGIARLHLSLSHCKEYAIAQVVAER
ncbi:MAG: holo-ACP synthase [Bacillota bacterium]